MVWSLVSLSSLAIILLTKRERVVVFDCFVAVCVLCLFLTVPWVGLRSATVTFPGQTHFLPFADNRDCQVV